MIESVARDKFFNAIEDKQLFSLLWARHPKTVDEAASLADGLEKLIDEPQNKSQHSLFSMHQDDRQNRRRPGYQGQNQYVGCRCNRGSA